MTVFRRQVLAFTLTVLVIATAKAEQPDMDLMTESGSVERKQQILDSVVFALECQRFMIPINNLEIRGDGIESLGEEAATLMRGRMHQCTARDVLEPQRAETALLRLADSGFLPAIEYFIKKPLPSISLNPVDEEALKDYEANADVYISKALNEGSGQAHFIHAKRLLASARQSGENETLLEAFVASEVAIECGYRNLGSYRLANTILRLLSYDVQTADIWVKTLVESRCPHSEDGLSNILSVDSLILRSRADL